MNAADLIKNKSWPTLGTVIQPDYTVKEQMSVVGPLIRGICCCRCCCFRSGTDEPPVIVRPGHLRGNDIAEQIFRLGEFELAWSLGGGGASLVISYSGKVLGASLPGRNFVGGASVSLAITQSRGSIEISESVHRTYAEQTVESISVVDDAITISGHLSHGRNPGDNSPQYSLAFRLCDQNAKSLSFDLQIYGGTKSSRVNQAHLLLASAADEALYGFGKQFSEVNCKGFEIPVVVEEGGIGRGDRVPSVLRLVGVTGESFSSYSPSPHFLSNTGRSLFLVNTEPSTFDLRSDGWLTVRVHTSRMQGCLLAGENPLDAIELLTDFIGRSPPLPEWVHRGAIVSIQGGTTRVRDIWNKLKNKSTPLAGIWLQDWVGRRDTVFGKQLWWNWVLNPSLYPDFSGLVDELKKADIATGIYINPFLVDVPERELNGRRNLYGEAKKRDFLVKDKDGTIYTVKVTFPVAVVDLSNEEARSWLKEVIQTELLSTGAKFWMADFGEGAQFDGVFKSSPSGLAYHNQYPVDWARLNREAVIDAGREDDVWFFTRSGFLESPRYTSSMWLGDQNVNWGENDGLPSAIDGLLSGGFSGFSISHSDIGGYTSISNRCLLRQRRFVRSRELLNRWMEMNAFTAIFRTHEGLEPEKNEQVYDDKNLEAFARWSKVYAALRDYRIELVQEATKKGYPVVRHPILHYPSDPKVYNCHDAFMLGSVFFVSPVVKKGAKTKHVYLPEGQWIHLWSGKSFDGGRSFNISAPLGEPPVFYLKGAEPASIVLERLHQDGVVNRPEFVVFNA